MPIDLTDRGVFESPFTWVYPFNTTETQPPGCYMPKKLSYLMASFGFSSEDFSIAKYPYGDFALTREFYDRNLQLTTSCKMVWGAWQLNVTHCVESAQGRLKSDLMYIPYVNFNGTTYSFDFSIYSDKNEIRAAFDAMMALDVSFVTSSIFSVFPYYVAYQGSIDPDVGDEIEAAYAGFEDYTTTDTNANASLDVPGVVDRWERLNRSDFFGGEQAHSFGESGPWTYLDLYDEVQFIGSITNATSDASIQAELQALYERIQAITADPSLRHGRGNTWIRYSNDDVLWYSPVPGSTPVKEPADYNWSEPIYGSAFHIPRNIEFKQGALPNTFDIDESLPPFSIRFDLNYDTEHSNDETDIIVAGGPATSNGPPWNTKMYYPHFAFPNTYSQWAYEYTAKGVTGAPMWNGYDPKQPDRYDSSGAFSNAVPLGLSVLYATGPIAIYDGKHWGYIKDRTGLLSPNATTPAIGNFMYWDSVNKSLNSHVRLSEFWWLDAKRDPGNRWHTATCVTLDTEPKPAVEPVPSGITVLNLNNIDHFMDRFGSADGFQNWLGHRLGYKDAIVAISNKINGQPYDDQVTDADKIRFKANKLYTTLGRKAVWPNSSFKITATPNYEVRSDYGYTLTETYDFLRSGLGLNHSFTSPICPNEVESRFVTWLRNPIAPSRTVIRCMDCDAPWYPNPAQPSPISTGIWSNDTNQWFTGSGPSVTNNPANILPMVLVQPHPYPVEVDRTLLFIDPAHQGAISGGSLVNSGADMQARWNTFSLSWLPGRGFTAQASFLTCDTLEEALLCLKTAAQLDKGLLIQAPAVCFLPVYKINEKQRPDPYDVARYVCGILGVGSILPKGVPFSVADPAQASIPWGMSFYTKELASRSAYASDVFWGAVVASTVKEYSAKLLNPDPDPAAEEPEEGEEPVPPVFRYLISGDVAKVDDAPYRGSIKFVAHHLPANSVAAIKAARMPSEIGRFDSTWQVKMRPGTENPDWPPYINGVPSTNYKGGQLADLFRLYAQSVMNPTAHERTPVEGRLAVEIYGTWALDGVDTSGATISSQVPGLGRGGSIPGISAGFVFGLNEWYNDGTAKTKPPDQ